MTAPAEETTTCANCGDTVSKSEWHPAAVETTAAGTVVRSFCSEHCRDQWKAAAEAQDATAGSTSDTTAD